MKNFPQFLNLTLCCVVTFTLAAQPEIKAAQQIVDAQQKEFRFFLDKITIDDNKNHYILTAVKEGAFRDNTRFKELSVDDFIKYYNKNKIILTILLSYLTYTL